MTTEPILALKLMALTSYSVLRELDGTRTRARTRKFLFPITITITRTSTSTI